MSTSKTRVRPFTLRGLGSLVAVLCLLASFTVSSAAGASASNGGVTQKHHGQQGDQSEKESADQSEETDLCDEPERERPDTPTATLMLRHKKGDSGDCSTSTHRPAVTAVKTNNADNSATAGDNFSTAEVASAVGAPVRFRVRVTNTSSFPVHVDGITDSVDGAAGVAVVCETTIGTLAAGASADCFFTMPAYSPLDSVTKSDVATVTFSKVRPTLQSAHMTSDSDHAKTHTVASNTSTVTTRVPLTAIVTKTNNANGDDVYGATETATIAGKAVPFRLHIVNTSAVPVFVDSVTDQIVDVTPPAASFPVTCSPALTSAIPPLGAADCLFTLPSYSPADALTKSNVATVYLRRPSPTPQLRRARLTVAAIPPPPTPITSTLSSVTTHVPVVVPPPVLVPPGPVPPVPPALVPPGRVPPALPPGAPAPGVQPPVTPGQDLGVSKSGPGSAHPGDELLWTIDVTNVRGTAATGFTVTDVLPVGVAYSIAGGTDFVCSLTGVTIACRYAASLPVGGTARIVVRGLLLEGFAGTSVANTAVLDPDTNPANDSSTAVTTITPVPGLPVIGGGGGGAAGVPIGGGAGAPGTTPVTTPVNGGGGGTATRPTLPFTGMDALRLLGAGVGLLLVGVVFALAARRRRGELAG